LACESREEERAAVLRGDAMNCGEAADRCEHEGDCERGTTVLDEEAAEFCECVA
jgi:uncharacterized Fe-S cluster protein YjdI